MDPLITDRKPSITIYKTPWHKRPVFYVLFAIALIIGYYAYQFSSAYNTISVENGPWWKSIANIWNFGKEKKVAPDPNPMPQPEQERLDILLLGIRGENEIAVEKEGGLLTDTIMIASIDKITKKIAIVSIPRDLYLEMDAQAANGKKLKIRGKINEIYERGLANGGGIALTKQIVSRITGIYIDNAIVADFSAFREIINNLGGIDVYLAKPFEEKSQWGYDFYLPAGNNHLDGDQALYYVRSRYSTDDFDRARRQQEVISIIKNRAVSFGFISNPVKVTSLLSDLKGNVRTDFDVWDIKNLAALANSFGTKAAIKNYVITTENLVYQSKTEKGEYILLPKEDNYEEIKKLFKTILN